MLLVMGLGPRFHVFLILGLPIVCSTFSGVVFCLDFSPFFFSLVPLPGVFPLFIYLFIMYKITLQNSHDEYAKCT
jgi:hypothetical protein